MSMRTLLMITVFLYSLSAKGQGNKQYKKIFKKELHLRPYTIPTKNYGPGTILILSTDIFGRVRQEHAKALKNGAFPHVPYAPSSAVPAEVISKVRKINFKVNVNDTGSKNKTNILPDNIEGVASMGFDQNTTFNFDMGMATKQEISEVDIDTAILGWDLKSRYYRTLISALYNETTAITAVGLQLKGAKFTFNRKTKLSPALSANLKTNALSAGLNFSLNADDSLSYTISSDSVLYYAYLPYSNKSTAVTDFIAVQGQKINNLNRDDSKW